MPRPGLLLASLVFVAAAGVGLWAGATWLAPSPEEQRADLQRAVEATVLPRDYARLPEVAVQTAAGEPLHVALADRWSVVFLGFTNCPDVCPLTLQKLDAAMDAWSGDTPAPQVLFVSVDAPRDTAADAAAYAESFDEDFLGASGELPALRTLADRLRVDFTVPESEVEPDAEYMVEHPSQVFLLDPQGRLRAVFSPPLAPERLAQDLQKLTTSLESGA